MSSPKETGRLTWRNLAPSYVKGYSCYTRGENMTYHLQYLLYKSLNFSDVSHTDAADVVLDADTAHPKLIISPKGDSATYTGTWQDVPETPSRFDNTLNVVSQQGFTKGRQYWEVEVSGKSYWELGLTYPSIPRKGRKEDCWLGRGKESWCVEYFNGDYTAWHGGVQHELTLLAGKQFTRIGVYCSFPGGLVCFLGADTMTPIHCFCTGTFTDTLHQALCPGHDNEGTNWKPLQIRDASRSAPVLWAGAGRPKGDCGCQVIQNALEGIFKVNLNVRLQSAVMLFISSHSCFSL